MDLNRYMMMKEKWTRFQSSRFPGTPARPIPINPQAVIPVSNGSQSDRRNTVDSVKFSDEFFQDIPQITNTLKEETNSCFSSMSCVDQNRGVINTWDNIGFVKPLNLSERSPIAEAKLTQKGNNNAATSPIDGDLQRLDSKIKNQNFSRNSNYSHHVPQARMIQHTGTSKVASNRSTLISNSQINSSFQRSYLPQTNQIFSSYGTSLNNSNYTHHIPQPSIPQRGTSNVGSSRSTVVPNFNSGFQESYLPGTNQSFSSSENLLNNSNYLHLIPHDEFRVPHHPTFDLYSSAGTLSDVVSNRNMYSQCSPVTTTPGKRSENHHPQLVNIQVEKRSDLVKNKQLDSVDKSREHAAENPSKDSLVKSREDSYATFTPFRANINIQNPEKTEGHGIEISKTPQQKPKRRKIRPRVVIEGKKPRNIPYSYAKQSSTKGNMPMKRKYVRKNSVSPSVNVAREVDTDQTAVKSCKRSLFDLSEETKDGNFSSKTSYQEGMLQSIVDNSSCMLAFNHGPEFLCRETCTESKSGLVKKSIVQVDRGLEVENSPAPAFDPNRSLTQILDRHISSADKPLCITPPPIREEPPGENMSIFTSNKNMWKSGNGIFQTNLGDHNHENAALSRFYGDVRLMSQNNSNYVAANEQSRGVKRGYNHIIDEAEIHSTNLIRNKWNTLHANQLRLRENQRQQNSSDVELLSPKANKKMRTEIDHITVNCGTPSSVESFLGPREAMMQKENNNRENQFAPQTRNRRLVPQLDNIITANHQNGGLISVPNVRRQAIANQYNCQEQTTWAGLFSQNQKPSWVTLGRNVLHSEIAMGFGQTDMIVKNRSNGPNNICELTSPVDCNNVPKTPLKMPPIAGDKLQLKSFSMSQGCIKDLPGDSHLTKTRIRRNTKKIDHENSVSSPTKTNDNLNKSESFVYDYPQASEKSRVAGSLGRQWKCNVPVDGSMQKQGNLTINGGRKTSLVSDQNVLVPFGEMVPYEKQFHHVKNWQLRARVDLDPETERVWKVLMGNETSNDAEEIDRDKEKWWEAERKVFRGRADSFIARMHLVQGDRRFTRWKGSVVDSVVGVFLTQNVSDHLSSSAFMSIVARFPLKSTCNSSTGHKEQKKIIIEEPEDDISWQGKMQRGAASDLEFFNLRGAHTEEKKTGHSTKSSGSNIGGSIDEWKNFPICVNSITGHNPLEAKEQEERITKGAIDEWKNSFCVYQPTSHLSNTQLLNTPSSDYFRHVTLNTVEKVKSPEARQTESRFYLPSNASKFAATKEMETLDSWVIPTAETIKPHQASSTNTATASMDNAYLPSRKQLKHPLISEQQEARFQTHQGSFNELQRSREETFQHQDISVKNTRNLVWAQAQRGSRMQSTLEKSLEISNREMRISLEDTKVQMVCKVARPNQKEQVHSSDKVSMETTINAMKGTGKANKEKKKEFDWDSLRRDVYQKGFKKERTDNTVDSVDWEELRSTDVSELAKAIQERGMNHMLAGRIKDFLNRLVRDHGSIDLEWLRDVPPDKAKEYLLSINGLGLKSVECIRLLTLHHIAFPVDTNVARIAVRLGWVPLQPLPGSLQLHLLEEYPLLDAVQKYLWPRLCKFDWLKLYELHYQMITCGKVFCTKNRPNCNSCPMRAECKHFASAFASARLALPGAEEEGIVTSVPVAANQNSATGVNQMLTPLLEANLLVDTGFRRNDCEPIIEEPASPENEFERAPESDIEDACSECPNEIPFIDLNNEEFTLNLQSYVQDNKIDLQKVDISNALVALHPQAASIKIRKLKTVNRLRTEHHVYELPDSHPLLKGMPTREPDDPCSYLLAIWTPGETAESTQPPEKTCGSQVVGNMCNEITCLSCNNVRAANSQMVKGTLLIPCRTATRGRFPLNGTYFQVNEVFADHESSRTPIDVPRAWIWNLPRRTVLIGTAIASIFKGQTAQEIQSCFWKGYVCVRGFDQKERAPRPLVKWLHIPGSKLAKIKTTRSKD